jgi:hypothetical protein
MQPVGSQAPVTVGSAGRRSRVAVPAVAAWSLGVLIILLCAALVPLAFAAREAQSDVAVVIILVSLAAVGIVVARRQPGNPLGWVFLVAGALSALGVDAGAYAVLSYRLGHHLPLGVAAVFLALYWCPVIVAFPLVILLFPDGRLPSPRWRPVLWGYLAVGACWPGRGIPRPPSPAGLRAVLRSVRVGAPPSCRCPARAGARLPWPAR